MPERFVIMAEQKIWKSFREEANSKPVFVRSGALNVALLFGLATIAITLIVTPKMAERTGTQTAEAYPFGVDDIKTGTIRKRDGTKEYIVRRSILQETPGAVCIINGDGSSSGCR